MKEIFVFTSLFFVLNSKGQQSFRIEKISATFHWSFSGTFSKKISDTSSLVIVPQNSNYEVSIQKNDGTVLCSCIYSIGTKAESQQITTLTQSGNAPPVLKDSAVQMKVLRPVSDNCIEKYKMSIGKSQSQR